MVNDLTSNNDCSKQEEQQQQQEQHQIPVHQPQNQKQFQQHQGLASSQTHTERDHRNPSNRFKTNRTIVADNTESRHRNSSADDHSCVPDDHISTNRDSINELDGNALLESIHDNVKTIREYAYPWRKPDDKWQVVNKKYDGNKDLNDHVINIEDHMSFIAMYKDLFDEHMFLLQKFEEDYMGSAKTHTVHQAEESSRLAETTCKEIMKFTSPFKVVRESVERFRAVQYTVERSFQKLNAYVSAINKHLKLESNYMVEIGDLVKKLDEHLCKEVISHLAALPQNRDKSAETTGWSSINPRESKRAR